ncbi:hypothetical protein ABT186_30790 [Streptomyces sp. NPDC001634]
MIAEAWPAPTSPPPDRPASIASFQERRILKDLGGAQSVGV